MNNFRPAISITDVENKITFLQNYFYTAHKKYESMKATSVTQDMALRSS